MVLFLSVLFHYCEVLVHLLMSNFTSCHLFIKRVNCILVGTGMHFLFCGAVYVKEKKHLITLKYRSTTFPRGYNNKHLSFVIFSLKTLCFQTKISLFHTSNSLTSAWLTKQKTELSLKTFLELQNLQVSDQLLCLELQVLSKL